MGGVLGSKLEAGINCKQLRRDRTREVEKEMERERESCHGITWRQVKVKSRRKVGRRGSSGSGLLRRGIGRGPAVHFGFLV